MPGFRKKESPSTSSGRTVFCGERGAKTRKGERGRGEDRDSQSPSCPSIAAAAAVSASCLEAALAACFPRATDRDLHHEMQRVVRARSGRALRSWVRGGRGRRPIPAGADLDAWVRWSWRRGGLPRVCGSAPARRPARGRDRARRSALPWRRPAHCRCQWRRRRGPAAQLEMWGEADLARDLRACVAGDELVEAARELAFLLCGKSR